MMTFVEWNRQRRLRGAPTLSREEYIKELRENQKVMLRPYQVIEGSFTEIEDEPLRITHCPIDPVSETSCYDASGHLAP